MRLTTLCLLALFALPLAAQLPPGTTPPPAPDPSAAKESFVVQPGSVDRGARAVAIRLVANQAAGFSNSSSKAPSLTFGAGVTLVAGSFQLLNQNEAQASIDVDNDAAGTVEVKLELFSVNGTKVLSTLRGTIGIKGTTPLAGSQASVGAESVKLVQVNVAAPQAAGALLISGKIAGSVTIKAPTGTAFVAAPTVTTDAGDINSPSLQQTNTVFSFSIGNASLVQVNVRVDAIQYNTQYFGLVAQQGDLACELSGAALSNQAALVVNAFTAKTTIAGSNDNTPSEPIPPATNPPASESSDSTSTPAPGNINTAGGGRSLDTQPGERRTRREDNNGGGARTVAPGGSTSNPGANPPPPPRFNQPNDGGAAPAPAPAVGGAGGAAAPAGGGPGANPMGGTGGISAGEGETKAPDKKLETAPEKPRVLEIDPGLHFCDKDFKPVTALVLDKAIAGEAGGRVWIVLKLKKDKQPDKIETVTVKLTVNGVMRELALTETGKNTGEFRCGKDGILVIANENPDSNAEEKPPEPPKPRFDR